MTPRRIRALPAAALLALAALAPRARAEEVRDTVRDVLQDSRYRFCHEDDYPLAPDEHAWCPMVGSVNGACPSLAKACRLPPVERSASLPLGHGRGRRGVRAQAKRGAPTADRPPQADERQRPPDLRFSLPDMSGLAQVLFFGLLAVFVVVVVRAIAGNLLRSRGAPATKDEGPPPDAPGGEPPPARGPVETDVERLLARARAAAERGDHARAVDDAYAALLRRLDGDGLIEIHPSRTNGDYVRALGDRLELRGAVRSIARDVEGVQFGATPPSDTVFRSVLARVLPLVSRGLALALVFFGLSTALSCAPHGGDDEGRGDASPSGTQAILEAVGKHGVKARRRSEPLSQLDRPLALVLLPEVVLDDAMWKELLSWVKDKGGHLVIAGVTPLPDELEQRIVADDVETTAVTVARGVHWVGHPELSIPPGFHIEPTVGPLQRPEGAVLLRGELAVVTERTVGEGRVVIVADDRVFTNAALAVDDDASFVVSLLFRSGLPPDREVELCDAWTGAGAQTPLESVQRANLTPVIVQLFVLVALLFLWKGRPFARLRDPPAEARRAFVDHARALGLAYQRARASRHVTGIYAVWALERLRERVHRAGRQGLIPLAEAIAARTGRSEGEVMSVLVDAAGARDEAAPPSSFRPQSRREGAARRGVRDAVEPDLALMRELMSFLAATGSRREHSPTSPTPPGDAAGRHPTTPGDARERPPTTPRAR